MNKATDHMISRLSSARLSALRANLEEARRHWRAGRGFGYPLCCVAHFCWDAATGVTSGQTRALQIELVHEGEWPYVYCGVFHKGNSPLSVAERIGHIAAFQWSLLKPSPRSRTIRAQLGHGLLRRRRWSEPMDWQFDRWWAHEAEQELWVDDGGLEPELDWR